MLNFDLLNFMHIMCHPILHMLCNVVLMLTNVVFYAIELKRGDVAALSS